MILVTIELRMKNLWHLRDMLQSLYTTILGTFVTLEGGNAFGTYTIKKEEINL